MNSLLRGCLVAGSMLKGVLTDGWDLVEERWAWMRRHEETNCTPSSPFFFHSSPGASVYTHLMFVGWSAGPLMPFAFGYPLCMYVMYNEINIGIAFDLDFSLL